MRNATEEVVMNLAELNKVAEAMVAPGRGILAADESSGTIKKRFDAIGVESTADTRRDYRELLFRSSEAMSKYISGVILYDETIRQNAKDGTPLVKLITAAGAVPGIKVDAGAKPLPFCPGETVTEGLDGLRERLIEYRKLGAKFAKWRAVIAIGEKIPTRTCINANAEALARYAALCQESDLVPIVEPEVLMDGTHTIERYFEVTQQTLESVFHALHEHLFQCDAMLMQSVKHAFQRLLRDFEMPFNRVRAIHEHLRFDDRHQIRFLTERRVTRQRFAVRLYACGRGDFLANCDHCAPFGKARSELSVFGQSLA